MEKEDVVFVKEGMFGDDPDDEKVGDLMASYYLSRFNNFMWKLGRDDVEEYLQSFWDIITREHQYSSRKKLPSDAGRCLFFLFVFFAALRSSTCLMVGSASSWDQLEFFQVPILTCCIELQVKQCCVLS